MRVYTYLVVLVCCFAVVSSLPPLAPDHPRFGWGYVQSGCLRAYFRLYASDGSPLKNDYIPLLYHEIVGVQKPMQKESEQAKSHKSSEHQKEARVTFTGVQGLYQGLFAVLLEGAAGLQNRIIGGREVPITYAPYQVIYDDRCGGAILSPDWVITAAHCGDNGDYVRAGSANFNVARMHFVCAHYLHPKWQEANEHPYDYDFQLLMLEGPITVTRTTMPIAIGNLDDIRQGNMVKVSGWGYVQEKGAMEEDLRMVDVPIIADDSCRQIPLKMYNITSRMFCAGYPEGKRDACQGDSGGPAVYNDKLIGLVSFGSGCGRAHKPGVYSNLPQVKDWIYSITGMAQYRIFE